MREKEKQTHKKEERKGESVWIEFYRLTTQTSETPRGAQWRVRGFSFPLTVTCTDHHHHHHANFNESSTVLDRQTSNTCCILLNTLF